MDFVPFAAGRAGMVLVMFELCAALQTSYLVYYYVVWNSCGKLF